MAGSTPNLGLYLPGGGSTGDYTPDEVADIDPLNKNFEKIDADVGTKDGRITAVEDKVTTLETKAATQEGRNQQFYGTAAGKASVTGMKEGDTYQESDGSKLLWVRVGTSWLLNESGVFMLRPTSVVGGTIGADGSVSATSGDNVLVNGVFTTRFRRYLVVAEWEVNGGANGAGWNFSKSGVPNTASSYRTQALVAGNLTVTANLATATSISAVGLAATLFTSELTVHSPATGVETMYSVNSTSADAGLTIFSGYHTTTTTFDGIKLSLSTTGSGRSFNRLFLRVYGYAGA